MSDDSQSTETSPTKATGSANRSEKSGRRWLPRLITLLLLVSVIANVAMYNRYQQYFSDSKPPTEKFHSGDKDAKDKIAVIRISGTIMPPFTGRILKSIDRVSDDADVKGVLLVIDSPGGLVADSHQIYHRLVKMRKEQKKPVFVAMQRIAASGGYYVAMGAGAETSIYVEPTTWTGSIGVIIPRFDVSELAKDWKIESAPLKTGPFKDALSPFRELSDEERAVWDAILDDAFGRFIGVIAENRKSLDEEAVKKLATGQIFTADQALKNGLVDKVGYEEDAIADLKKKLGLEKARVVTYQHAKSIYDLLLGSAEAEQPAAKWNALLDATVPRAMYFCSWAPGMPVFD